MLNSERKEIIYDLYDSLDKLRDKGEKYYMSDIGPDGEQDYYQPYLDECAERIISNLNEIGYSTFAEKLECKDDLYYINNRRINIDDLYKILVDTENNIGDDYDEDL